MKKLKKKKKEKYEKARCAYYNEKGKRCKKGAAGKTIFCVKHGGSRKIQENQLVTLRDSTLAVKYDPTIHPMLAILMAKDGCTITEIAAQCKVHVSTLYDWAERYSEFEDALEICRTLHEAWWIKKGKNNLENGRFQTPLYKFLAGNLLGWSDKIESKSLNTNLSGVLVVPGKLDKDDWEKAYEEEQKKLEGDIIDAEVETDKK